MAICWSHHARRRLHARTAHAGKETNTTIEPHPASGSAAFAEVAAGRIRVLLVEPRRIYADILTRTLRADEFAVDVACSEAAALAAVREDAPDVVVVCLGPSEHGAAVLDRVRQAARCGVVALTDTELAPLVSRVAVVPLGGYDVLSMRIRQTLRRFRLHSGPVTVQPRHFDDLVIDVEIRRVYQRGNVIPPTRTEFAILRVLSDDPGEPVTCHQLQEFLWGTVNAGGRSALGVHIGNLRRKLGDAPTCPRYVRTVRGIGYCLAG